MGQGVSVGMYAGYGDRLTAGQIEIVGVCADTLYCDLHEAPPPQLFVPFVQQTQVRRLTYQIRTQTKPEAIQVDAVRHRAVRPGGGVWRHSAVDGVRVRCQLDSGAACGERRAD